MGGLWVVSLPSEEFWMALIVGTSARHRNEDIGCQLPAAQWPGHCETPLRFIAELLLVDNYWLIMVLIWWVGVKKMRCPMVYQTS